jgi:hypothetical protein
MFYILYLRNIRLKAIATTFLTFLRSINIVFFMSMSASEKKYKNKAKNNYIYFLKII